MSDLLDEHTEKIYERAINSFGDSAQLLMLFEEMAELQEAIYLYTNNGKSQIKEKKFSEILNLMGSIGKVQKDFCKHHRKNNNQREGTKLIPINEEMKENVADEIADVRVMLDQLELILNIKDLVLDRKIFKIKRLENRLEEWDKQKSKRCSECYGSYEESLMDNYEGKRMCEDCRELKEFDKKKEKLGLK
jgi:hypothetical protein